VGFIGDFTGQAFAVASQFNQAEMTEIDNKAAKDKERIMNSVMSEEEKAAAIANIDAKTEIQKRKLRQQAAKQEKAAGIISVAISTAQAVMKGFAQLGPIFGAIATGATIAMGAAQIAAIAAQPLPMAEGAFVESRPGGVVAQIGEGRQDEMVMPMQTGMAQLIQGVKNGLAGDVLPSGRSVMAGGAAPASPAGAVHFHIGTLVADDRGLKELERRMVPIRNAEAQRKGQA
jgi:hypothetical protein